MADTIRVQTEPLQEEVIADALRLWPGEPREVVLRAEGGALVITATSRELVVDAPAKNQCRAVFGAPLPEGEGGVTYDLAAEPT